MKTASAQHILLTSDDIKDVEMYSDATDERLARQAQQGDREAFLALYNRYLNKVYNRVRSRIPSSDVDDVTQEIFIAVVRSIGRFEGKSRFNTWLYTIVSRQIADFYRRRNRGSSNPDVSLEAMTVGEPSYEHEHLDERAIVQVAMQRVPDHYREIILMRFADGMTFAEIAKHRGQSLEAVKSLYRRAIQAVRDEIGEGQ